MERREMLFWTLGAAGLGLVRYLMLRSQYQTGGLAAQAAAAAAVGDIAGVAIPQLQHPAMLLAAHEAQRAAKHFYHRVPYAPPRRPQRPPVGLKIKDAEFEIIEEKADKPNHENT